MWEKKIIDGFNFTSKLTFQRIWNAAKVIFGYYSSRIIKKPVLPGYPVSVSIEPTTACNLRCPECPSGLRSFTRPTGMLKMDTFQNIINQVSKNAVYLILYFQGEPYLNPLFFDFVSYASKKKKMYVATSTNAHYLDDDNARKTVESGLSRLIISIDGTTQDTYESYRIGGKLDKVLEGTANVVKWKKKLRSSAPHIMFQFLVVKPNEHQTNEVIQLAKQYGVDEVVFKTAQLYDYQKGNPLMPENEKFSRYKKEKNGTFKIKNKLLDHCWKLWHACVFTWDGRVLPCCFDKDAQHSLGSINNNDFKTIWKNEKYQEFRGMVLKSRKEIDICSNCTEGTKIWA